MTLRSKTRTWVPECTATESCGRAGTWLVLGVGGVGLALAVLAVRGPLVTDLEAPLSVVPTSGNRVASGQGVRNSVPVEPPPANSRLAVALSSPRKDSADDYGFANSDGDEVRKKLEQERDQIKHQWMSLPSASDFAVMMGAKSDGYLFEQIEGVIGEYGSAAAEAHSEVIKMRTASLTAKELAGDYVVIDQGGPTSQRDAVVGAYHQVVRYPAGAGSGLLITLWPGEFADLDFAHDEYSAAVDLVFDSLMGLVSGQ